MVDIPTTTDEFIERLKNLSEDYYPDENTIIIENIDRIKWSIKNRDTQWIFNWLIDIKKDALSRSDDADYIGYFMCECDRLLAFFTYR